MERLQIGDLVLTAHNGPRPVTWIGQGKVLATRGRRTRRHAGHRAQGRAWPTTCRTATCT